MLESEPRKKLRGRIMELPTFSDERGFLTVMDGDPFVPKRAFWVYGGEKERGNHAHDTCEQLLVAVHGEVKVVLSKTGHESQAFNLTRPNQSLYVPAGEFIDYQPAFGSVLLVLCSHPYDSEDYSK